MYKGPPNQLSAYKGWMHTLKNMPKRYSNHFKVPAKAFEKFQVFNAFVDQDTRFHVDPLLLRGSNIPEFKDAYDDFLAYFRGFVPLVKHVTQAKETDFFFRKIIKRFTFPELQYTGLGYSKGHSHGNGISGKLSIQLAHTAYKIIKAGHEDPEIFALMPLIEDQIGPDRISDMTIAILRPHFLAYTQRISHEMGIETSKYRLTYDTYFQVPLLGKDTIHFVPKVFLNDLPIATSFKDIADVADYNERLKAKLAEIIGISWRDCEKYSKDDWKEIILGNKDCYKAAIDYYKAIKGVPYDFDADKHNKYWDLKYAYFAFDNPIQFLSRIFTSPGDKIFNWTMDICKMFKKLVEDNRMSELVHRKRRTPDETDWQLMLYMTAEAYKEGGNLNLDISRENNPGNGEIDFKFSQGEAKTIVEIKRSENKDLLHGYRTQLPGYMRAENTSFGIFIVVFEEESHKEETEKELEGVKNDMLKNCEAPCPILFIKGYHQPSASKQNYKL